MIIPQRIISSSFFFFVTYGDGGSQARGLIRAVATAYARATAMPDPGGICDLYHGSQQMPDP